MNLPDRPNLSQWLAAQVREMIFNGVLAAGSQVNEVHLAARLGVSRTPLREALSALVAEKALTIQPRRGFFVNPLTAREAREIYAIRPILDVEALRLAGIPSPIALDRLATLNSELSACQIRAEAVRLDDDWHFTLLAGCQNETLMDMIRQIVLRTHRYELAVMAEPEVLQQAVKTHAEIEDALRVGRLEAACDLLRLNLSHGIDPVLQWLGNTD